MLTKRQLWRCVVLYMWAHVALPRLSLCTLTRLCQTLPSRTYPTTESWSLGPWNIVGRVCLFSSNQYVSYCPSHSIQTSKTRVHSKETTFVAVAKSSRLRSEDRRGKKTFQKGGTLSRPPAPIRTTTPAGRTGIPPYVFVSSGTHQIRTHALSFPS